VHFWTLTAAKQNASNYFTITIGKHNVDSTLDPLVSSCASYKINMQLH